VVGDGAQRGGYAELMRRIDVRPRSQREMFGERADDPHLEAEDFKPVITRAWVVKTAILYVGFLTVVWYLGWKYLGSGMTH